MNDSIIIRDIKNADQRLEKLRNDSYEYTWDNYILSIFHRNRILVKLKKGIIYAVIPYSTEKRKFVGRFYEDNGMLCLEGFWFLVGILALALFSIWYLARYRNKKYEQKIAEFIIDILVG